MTYEQLLTHNFLKIGSSYWRIIKVCRLAYCVNEVHACLISWKIILILADLSLEKSYGPLNTLLLYLELLPKQERDAYKVGYNKH